MDTTRRTTCKLIGGCLALAATADLGRAAPAEPPGDLDRALRSALGGRHWSETDLVRLEVPELAENGAIVPVTVSSRLPDTRRILLFGEKNPGPLLARFDLGPGTDGFISIRLKLNASGHVLAIAESKGAFYGTRKWVQVMVGGCG